MTKTVAYEPAGSEKLRIAFSSLFLNEKFLKVARRGRSPPFMLSSGMAFILNISGFIPNASMAAFS
ncbi:MAG: hypothetical protein QXF41_01885 [Candidatus Micrarchaeaceae archaeon]